MTGSVTRRGPDPLTQMPWRGVSAVLGPHEVLLEVCGHRRKVDLLVSPDVLRRSALPCRQCEPIAGTVNTPGCNGEGSQPGGSQPKRAPETLAETGMAGGQSIVREVVGGPGRMSSRPRGS